MSGVVRNIGTLLRCLPEGGQAELHPVPDAALVWEDEHLSWVGPEADLPPQPADRQVYDAAGLLLVPGLIDCHTHLAFGGWRSDEFVQRIQGKSYAEIARSGGGIARTVDATRAASDDALRAHCRFFLDQAASQGITTVECKSGYGLTTADELRILELYRRLSTESGPAIISTFLGAHHIPAEYRQRRDDYVRLLIEEMIPEVGRRQLSTFCDVFLEEIALTPSEARRILSRGIEFGLRPKVHADQLADGGGASLAVDLGAASADHLECVSAAGIEALAASDTVAVSLPLAALYLGQDAMPARRLIDAGAAVAVATDFNPGSAPSNHLPLAMLLACTCQAMTPAEVLKAVTHFAARALDLQTRKGSLAAGFEADFAVIDAPDVQTWISQFRPGRCVATVRSGKVIWGELSQESGAGS